jgi:hypothetical protein
LIEMRKLNPKQHKVISLLLAGHTQRSAAQIGKVGEATVARWVAKDDFADALKEGQDRICRDTERLLAGSLSKAVETLVSVLEESKTSPVVKVNAARALLDYGLKFRSAGELESRIANLEDKIIK